MNEENPILRSLSDIFGVKFVEAKTIKYMKTNIKELDESLDFVWTEGSIIEFYGSTGTGKTTILDRIARQFNHQVHDERSVFFDCDHSKWNKDPDTRDNAIFCRPHNLSELKEIACALIKDAGVKIVLIDSINSLPIEDENGEEIYTARHNGELRKAIGEIAMMAAQHKAYVAVTSQVRSLDRVLVSASKGIKSYAVSQIYLERLSTIKRVKESGCRVKATLITKKKNSSCEFELVFPGGKR